MAKTASYMRAYRARKKAEKKPDTSYQGQRFNKAYSQGDLLHLKEILPEELAKYPKQAEGAQETIAQIEGISSLDDVVTVYRATPGTTINESDWVFMTKSQAEKWATGTFTGKAKPGYNVVTAKVRAGDVGWTGKNLEFVYMGNKSVGKAAAAKDIDLTKWKRG